MNDKSLTQVEYVRLLARGVEEGRFIAFMDDDGDVSLIAHEHASARHRAAALSARALQQEADREESAPWN